MMAKADLKLDWCSYAAAKYAVTHWHYSKCLPASKSQYIGVWEDQRFIGSLIFGCGAGNVTKGTQFGLERMRMAELTRVALAHHQSPVSRIMAIAIKMIARQNPQLRLLVSLADPVRGHVGAIYQAQGWIYVGETSPSKTYIGHDGREFHMRVVSASGVKKHFGRYVSCPKPEDMASTRIDPGKHKYLMPLDAEMRERILSLAKPYPKRAGSAENGMADHQSAGGGVIPTSALQTIAQAQ